MWLGRTLDILYASMLTVGRVAVGYGAATARGDPTTENAGRFERLNV